ncbi:hypothetical protein TTHERM_00162890 (macronuclear) [Tetrahymena thermophila SB210]|uniref:Uncharacterized protein n=1 Tax=Tetrahymena thermophila (strain SB210) TaxID=312017 RepID=Q22TP1_TETTS|nr:hypothetical protein TTHERM_00162890 [Tetrahymena thermophila SB210]EAR88397.3 hypothetical protein TTHERM_00162890 [Tetrahymena thermophila SB210]|eukprot:XP_001008642.3 hypothetical protein TTHERM_00162890 [Tetrahymena thermophila SB210]
MLKFTLQLQEQIVSQNNLYCQAKKQIILFCLVNMKIFYYKIGYKLFLKKEKNDQNFFQSQETIFINLNQKFFQFQIKQFQLITFKQLCKKSKIMIHQSCLNQQFDIFLISNTLINNQYLVFRLIFTQNPTLLMNHRNPYDYQNYRSPVKQMFTLKDSLDKVSQINGGYGKDNGEKIESPFKYHPKKELAENQYEDFQHRFNQNKLKQKLELIQMDQRYLAQKADLLKNQTSLQRGNQQLQKDINYNNPNDPFYQDEEERRIIDRYESNFKIKNNKANNHLNSQFELDQLLNGQDEISPEKKKKARFLDQDNYNNYDMKSPNIFQGKSVDRVQLLQYLKNGVIQPTHLNQYFNYESDQVFKFAQSPYSQINIEQKGRLRNYESAINLAASSILQDRYTYSPYKKNDLVSDKIYKPHSGFILKWDFVTELPFNVEKIRVNYGFFQKGDSLFTYRSTEEQRNDLVYRSTTHHYQTTSEKSIRKCLISETLPIKNIKLNAESVLYFDLWIWEKNNLSFPSIYGWSLLEMLADDLSVNAGKFKLPLYSKEYNPYLIYQTGIPYKSDIVFLYLTIMSPDDEVRVKSQTSLVEQYIIPKIHLKPQNKEILQKFKSETDRRTFGRVYRKVQVGDDTDDAYAQEESLRKDILHNGLYQPQDRPFNPKLQPNNGVQDQFQREDLIKDKIYFKTIDLNLHSSLLNKQNINFLFTMNKIENLQLALNILILRIRIFVMYGEQMIYSRQDDQYYKVSRENNCIEIDYNKYIEFDFDFQQLLQEQRQYKQLILLINFMDVDNNEIGWISQKLIQLKEKHLMPRSGNMKQRLRQFSNVSEEYEQSDNIVDFFIKIDEIEDDNTSIMANGISKVQKQIFSFQFKKIYNLEPKDQQLFYSIQLKKDDQQNPDIVINDQNFSEIVQDKLIINEKINNLEYTTLATQQIQVQKKDLRKLFSFHNQNIFLEISLYSQIPKKPLQLIGKGEIPIIYNSEQGYEFFEESAILKIEIKPINVQNNKQNQIYGDFQIQFVKEHKKTLEFYSTQSGFNIKLNELIDYPYPYFTYDISVQVFKDRLYDNFGKLCQYQYPKQMRQTKKGTILIKQNLIIPLNIEKLKQEYNSQIDSSLILIKIYTNENNKNQLYGWCVHQLIKKDQYNIGDFKVQLLEPPIDELQLLNKTSLKKTKAKLTFSIQNCRLDDVDYLAKLASQK